MACDDGVKTRNNTKRHNGILVEERERGNKEEEDPRSILLLVRWFSSIGKI